MYAVLNVAMYRVRQTTESCALCISMAESTQCRYLFVSYYGEQPIFICLLMYKNKYSIYYSSIFFLDKTYTAAYSVVM